MRRIVKIAGVVFTTVLIMVLLAGCGNNNTIVASREVDVDEVKFTEVLEATFRGGRVDTVVSIFEFESEEEAKIYYDAIMSAMTRLDVTHTGRTIEIKVDVEELADHGLEGTTREEYVRHLEEQGFTIR